MNASFNYVFLTGYVKRCTHFKRHEIDYTRIDIMNTTIHEGQHYPQELFLYIKGEQVNLEEDTHLVAECRLICRDKKHFLYCHHYSTSPSLTGSSGGENIG